MEGPVALWLYGAALSGTATGGHRLWMLWQCPVHMLRAHDRTTWTRCIRHSVGPTASLRLAVSPNVGLILRLRNVFPQTWTGLLVAVHQFLRLAHHAPTVQWCFSRFLIYA